jgi:hypothetical protein
MTDRGCAGWLKRGLQWLRPPPLAAASRYSAQAPAAPRAEPRIRRDRAVDAVVVREVTPGPAATGQCATG